MSCGILLDYAPIVGLCQMPSPRVHLCRNYAGHPAEDPTYTPGEHLLLCDNLVGQDVRRTASTAVERRVVWRLRAQTVLRKVFTTRRYRLRGGVPTF